MFPCRLFSHCAAPYAEPGDKPSLVQIAWIVSLQLVFPYCKALGQAVRVAWPWLWCLEYLFAGCLPVVQCHMPGRANSLALAQQSYFCTSTMCFHCIATSWARRFAWPWLRQTYGSLVVCLCTGMLALPS